MTNFSFCDLATTGVQGLKPYEPGKPLAELERDYGIRDAIKLASNENPLGPSASVMAATKDALKDMARYPDGNGFALKAVLAQKHQIEAACITLGNGSNDVLEFVARAFLAPGLESIFSQHAFAVYPIVTQAVGATARIVQAHDGSQGIAYGHDLNAMAALVSDKTRVVFIANPNNPTGTWLKADELEAFISRISSEVIIVLDEAYAEYIAEPEYPDSVTWIKRYPNLVVTRTFSKAFGLAGLRVGYALSHPEIADILNRVRQPFNLNAIAQVAAVAALGDIDHLQQSIRVNRLGMAQWIQALERLRLSYIPSEGNFICVDVNRPAGDVYEALLREGVIVRPVANYGLPRHLRISIGLEQENQRAITALEKVLV